MGLASARSLTNLDIFSLARNPGDFFEKKSLKKLLFLKSKEFEGFFKSPPDIQ